MIDKALIGAIERAFERNEPREYIRHSLISSGYSPQDVEEAINLVVFRGQQAPKIISVQQPQPQQQIQQLQEVKKHFSLSWGKETIIISAIGLALFIFLVFLVYIWNIQSSCNSFNIPTLKKEVLGLSVNCSQVNIIFVETWIAILTTIALLAVVILLTIRKKQG